MNFTVSTKPLQNALSLGVVKSNISKFYQKSCLAKISCNQHEMKINLEADSIKSQITLNGSGNEDSENLIFVDCVLFNDLVNTFDKDVTSIEFVEGGIQLHSGSAKFTLPQALDESDLELDTPQDISTANSTIEFKKDNWKFIDNYQMYAVALSFIHPIYTKVWVGENEDVLVGDFDNSLFTHSKKSNLGVKCVLKPTIINMLNSLPEGATIYKMDKSYVVNVSTDGYNFLTEFTPEFEEDEGVGEYNSEVILNMFENKSNTTKVKIDPIIKLINQSTLLSNNTESTIEFGVGYDNNITLKDNNMDAKIPMESPISEAYTITFKTVSLKSVISNLNSDEVSISPYMLEGDYVGMIFDTGDLQVVLAGQQE